MSNETSASLSNVEIASHLRSLAQMLSTQGENPFKIKAYRRAAETLGSVPESVAELVQGGSDLTRYSGIGKGIAGAIREIVEKGALRQLESLRAKVSPEIAALSEYPRLDPKRVLRAYKALKIGSVQELKEKLETGEILRVLGARMAQHVSQAMVEQNSILLYDADDLVPAVHGYLLDSCGATRVEAAGDYRRRTEVVSELIFLVLCRDFPGLVAKFQRFGGRTPLLEADGTRARFKHPLGVELSLRRGSAAKWGLDLLDATGSPAHLEALEAYGADLARIAGSRTRFPNEASVYRKFGLRFIEPERREGGNEVAQAARGRLPRLVSVEDIRGELHAHSTGSDGAHTIEEMAEAAKTKGYDYLGITDHSRSLTIAGGLSVEDLRKQLRAIDKLNARLKGIRILKSAEVDILADGTLDYPDDLLSELDYTVCSLHSRFSLGKQEQTERILRAMDNPHFTILGHATGRLLLRRSGYDLQMERVVAHARERGCFFEINCSPDRLDLSAAHARLARDAGVKVAICTDAHRLQELDWTRNGVDQARRAGLTKECVLNTRSWTELRRLFRR